MFIIHAYLFDCIHEVLGIVIFCNGNGLFNNDRHNEKNFRSWFHRFIETFIEAIKNVILLTFTKQVYRICLKQYIKEEDFQKSQYAIEFVDIKFSWMVF